MMAIFFSVYSSRLVFQDPNLSQEPIMTVEQREKE